MLEYISDISPWWWITLAFILATVEALTATFFLIWIACAAFIMAIIIALISLSIAMQLIVFAVLSLIFTICGRYLLKNYGDGSGVVNNHLNQRAAYFINKTGKILTCVNNKCTIEIDGMPWKAEFVSDEVAEIGALVQVTAAKGMILYVKPLK